MKKYIISWMFAGGIFMSFGAVAFAQVSTVGGTVGGGAASGAYASTGMITNVDLGVADVGTLPTSSFYFFKEWKRGLSRAFTWNTTKEAELELRIANEKAAEALKVEEENPANKEAIKGAIENYTKAHVRLQARLVGAKGNSENPNTQALLEKLDKQSLTHATLFGQIATRWNTDPYVEDVARNGVNSDAVRDNHLQGAVDILQKNIQTTLVVGVEKEKNIKEKAEQQIKRTESELALLKVELAKFMLTATATNVVRGNNESRESSESSAGKAAVRIDNTPARISTNLTIARQTPKRDFGDRMKAGLETAGGMLANGKVAFAEGKFGEAFGQARGAEVMARNLRSAIMEFAIKEQGVKAVNPLYEEQTKGENPFFDKKAQDIKACGPQVGAPGNWVCKDSKWQLVAKPAPKSDEQIACTKEAKLCADGSSVERTGPRCEFAKCPALKPVAGMGCPAYSDPVCGANGESYSNECQANVAGVKVFTKGECPVPKSVEGGVTCPGYVEPVCGADGKTYSNICFANGAGVKVFAKGECPVSKPREGMMCTAQYDPVCGADGKTYSNSCTAGVAGVNVVTKGECAATPSSSSGTMIKVEADGAVSR